MQIITDRGFLIGIIILAVCLTGIIEGAAEDSEKRRLVRRERYRREAYKQKDLERRRTELFKAVSR